MNSLDIEIIDVVDLLDFTFSPAFTEKWRYKYSERFIKYFQLKFIEYLKKGKPIKLKTMNSYLTKKCGYSQDQVNNFFESIDISLYAPIIF